MAKKAFRYRIYPTKKQEETLNRHLSLCGELYNAGLEERREAYRMCGTREDALKAVGRHGRVNPEAHGS